jgi:hypothetical protein
VGGVDEEGEYSLLDYGARRIDHRVALFTVPIVGHILDELPVS